MKKMVYKGIALLAMGAFVAQLGFAGGCLDAAVQRILVAVNFD